MRNLFISVTDGSRRIHWPTITAVVISVYASMIVSAEVFWKLFTGGYSTLIGLYAFFTATLIVVRVIGGSFADPYVHTESGVGSD